MSNISNWNNLEENHNKYNMPLDHNVFCDECGAETVDTCICEDEP